MIRFEVPKPNSFMPEVDFILLKGPSWVFEPKIDGWRVIVTPDGVFTRHWRRLQLDIKAPEGFIFDGELCFKDPKESTNYKVSSLIKKNPKDLMIVLFDIIMYDGKYLCDSPLSIRKYHLERALNFMSGPCTIIDFYPASLLTLDRFVELKTSGFEGVVFKNLDENYFENTWVKLKDVNDFKKALKMKRLSTFNLLAEVVL